MEKAPLKSVTVAEELVAEYRRTKNLEQLLVEVCAWGWWFGRYGRYNRELFQDKLLGFLRSKKPVTIQVCNECGDSVRPGYGKFVNRVPDLNDPERRKEMGRPFPKGDYICAECNGKEVKP